jgi:hypothetical protein
VPTTSAPSPLPSAAPAGKLLAHFTFDDCSARDDTGNGHDGHAVGKPVCVDGAVGKALQFDGKQYLTIDPIVSDDSLRSQITVTGWVKASGYDDGYKRVAPVLTFGHAGFMKAPFAVGYEVLGGKLLPVTTMANAAGQTYSTRLFSGGGAAQHWFFFAWVFQAGRLNVYMNDGAAVGCNAGFTELSSSAAAPIELGRNKNGIAGYLVGTLDDIRIYDYALSATEIRKLWQLGSPDDVQ